MSTPDEFIIAHRGESFDAPENTLASINLAWQRNVKAVEIDVQFTRDGEIVVIHDNDTLRISGKKLKIKESKLLELKQLDFGLFKDRKWANERIPTLAEVLKTVPEQGKLIIEIKSDESLLYKLKQDLEQSNLRTSQIEIIAFNINTLGKAKQLMPQYKMLWLLDLDYFWPWWLLLIRKKRIIRKISNLNLDGIDVWAGKLLTLKFIDTFRKAGFLIYCWTVNNPEQAKKLINLGIDGITTDRARWLLNQIENSD
ncbi:MAG: glycerophosphodiester phosphodiesterase [Prolixibacteraceae bacterium]